MLCYNLLLCWQQEQPGIKRYNKLAFVLCVCVCIYADLILYVAYVSLDGSHLSPVLSLILGVPEVNAFLIFPLRDEQNCQFHPSKAEVTPPNRGQQPPICSAPSRTLTCIPHFEQV